MFAPLVRQCRWLVLCALLLAACGRARSVTVIVEREELQTRLASKFPVDLQQPLARVRFESPQVVLREGSDRIGVTLRLRLGSPLLADRKGKVTVLGKLLYLPAEKAFYLKQPELEWLELEGVPPDQLQVLRPLVETMARPALEQQPVYKLQGKDLTEVSAGYLLKGVSVRDGKVYAKFGM